jgi:hypothetical protein
MLGAAVGPNVRFWVKSGPPDVRITARKDIRPSNEFTRAVRIRIVVRGR